MSAGPVAVLETRPEQTGRGATGRQRMLLVATAAVSPLLVLWAANSTSDASLLGCLATVWLVLAANARSLGVVAFCFGALSLYASGPWLASVAGTRYPPFYRHAVLLSTSAATTASVIAALGLVALVSSIVGTRPASAVWRAWAATPPRPRSPWAHVLGVVAWVLVLRDLVVLAPIVGDVLASPRRAFADEFWTTSSANVQIVLLAAAAVAAMCWPVLTRGLRALLLPPVLAALAMQLSVGSRKEVLLGVALVLPLLWLRRSRRWPLGLGAGTLVAVGLALPLLRDADSAVVPTEFALPGYASVAALQGQISSVDIPYDFWLGFWGLVPSPLRLADVDIDIGTYFAHYGFQSVGIGATPWLETALAFPGSPLVAATLVIACLVIGWQLLSRHLPLLAVTAWPFLMLLGRSTFWITVFGVVTLTLLTAIATVRDTRPN